MITRAHDLRLRLRALARDRRVRIGAVAFLLVAALWVAVGTGLALGRSREDGTPLRADTFTTERPADWVERTGTSGQGLAVLAAYASPDDEQRLTITRAAAGTGRGALCDAIVRGALDQGLATGSESTQDPEPLDGREVDQRLLTASDPGRYRAELRCVEDGEGPLAVLLESAPAPSGADPSPGAVVLEHWRWTTT